MSQSQGRGLAKVQEEAAGEEGKDGDQARLMKDLLEFQMMAAEEDFKDYI